MIVAACIAAVLPALIPYDRFLQLKVRSDTLMIVPLWNLQDHVGLPRLDDVVLLGGIVAAALFVFVPRRYLLVLPAFVLLYFAAAIQPIQAGPHGMEQAAAGALFEGIRVPDRAWIDRAVPDDDVAVLWTGKTNRFTVNMNEFFNRKVGRVYTLGGPMPGGLPETPVRVDPETGEIRRADGSVVEEGYVLTDGTIAMDGDEVAADADLGLAVYGVGGPLVSTTSVSGVDNDLWSGPKASYRRVRCRGGTLEVTLGSDPRHVQGGADRRRQGSERAAAGVGHLRAARHRQAPRPARARGRRLQGRLRDLADRGARRRRPAGAGRALPRVRLHGAVRVVYDVSPLSHPLTGVGNYVRGSLAGLVEAAGGAHELVAFAPTSPAGRKAIPRALDGLDVELRLVPLPLSQRWRDGWSRLGRPALERFVGAFDVFHYSDWMYPPQAGGVRATTVHDLVPLRFPEWVTPKTAAMHGAKYANTARTADLVFVNSEYTGRDVVERLGVGSDRVRVAYPGVKDAFRPDGDHADLGRPYVLTVATLEPRKNLETLVAAHRLLGDELLLAVAGGSGWGDQPELRGANIVRLGFVSDDELARLYRGAAAAVYPSRFEGFGMPIIEAMACGAPTVASAHASMDEAAGAAAIRADPDDPEAIAAAIREALDRRDELVPAGLEHARRFTWRAAGETFLAGYEEASR